MTTRYMIRSDTPDPEGGDLYWSDSEGWTTFPHADRYPDDKFHPPIGGTIVTVAPYGRQWGLHAYAITPTRPRKDTDQ
jgi:hypothetical protein